MKERVVLTVPQKWLQDAENIKIIEEVMREVEEEGGV
jgi:hypothetical protein